MTICVRAGVRTGVKRLNAELVLLLREVPVWVHHPLSQCVKVAADMRGVGVRELALDPLVPFPWDRAHIAVAHDSLPDVVDTVI